MGLSPVIWSVIHLRQLRRFAFYKEEIESSNAGDRQDKPNQSYRQTRHAIFDVSYCDPVLENSIQSVPIHGKDYPNGKPIHDMS